MPEAQEIIGQVRDALAARDQSATPELRDLATAYAELCRSANDRIRRCCQLLRQGLKTEAVNLAEADPNLLDQLTMLDFPQRGDWQQWCAQYGFPEAPPLDMESAGVINEAYAAMQPIEVLLAKHRRLALALAPLPLRLVVMREIAKVDKTAQFWADDIRTFETARLEEIRRQWVAAAPADRQLPLQLHSELANGQWSVPIPGDLLRAVKTRAEKIQSENIQKRMQPLLAALDTAYSAMEEQQSRELLGQCQEVLGNSTPAEDVKERMAAVQAWLEGLDKARAEHAEFEKACAGLQQAIDNARATDEIRQAYQATTRFTEPLPMELENRYQACLARREREAARRRRMIYFGAAAAALVVLVAIGIFTFVSIRNHEAAGWAGVLQAADRNVVQRGDLADGQKVLAMVAAAPADVRQAPAVAAGAAELRHAVAAEKVREASFRRLYTRAQGLGVGSARALAAMKAAQAIARRPAEKAAVTAWFAKQRLYAQSQQARRDAAFNKAAAVLFKQINDELSKVAIADHPAAARRALRALTGKAGTLRSTRGITLSLYQAEVTSLQAMLRRRRTALLNAISDDVDYQKILVPPASVSSYVAAVQAYVKAHPDGRFIRRVDVLAGQAAGDQAVDAWSNMVQGWGGRILNPHRAEVAARIAAIGKYRAAFPGSPLDATAMNYQAYLAGGLAATAAGGPWRGPLSHVLHNRLLRRLDELSATNGRVYFVRPNTRVAVGRMGSIKAYQFKAVLSADYSQRLVVLPVGVSLKSEQPKPSPQRVLVRWCVRAIGNMNFGQWNTMGLKIMRRLEASPISPVLKGILVSDLIILDKPLLSPRDARQFADAAGRLNNLNLENINWLNPKKPPPGRVVRGVAKALARLPDAKALMADIAGTRDSLARRVNFSPESLGVFTDGPGKPAVACTAAPRDGSIAWVVAGSGGAARLERFGRFTAGHWHWSAEDDRTVANGSLVFISGPGK